MSVEKVTGTPFSHADLSWSAACFWPCADPRYGVNGVSVLGEVDRLLRHLRVMLGRELLPVRDDVEAGVDRALRAVAGLDVRVHLGAALRRLGDEQLDVVDRVAPRLAVEADLDHLGAEQHVLADRLDDFVAAVRLEVLGIDDVVPLVHLRRRRELAAGAAMMISPEG